MPKRTNDFQEVVDSIHRLFAPKNAKVTTSAMVMPSHGGTPREVDILIEFETDLHIPFKIAVEAKDHSRPIDSTGIENYIGKYNNNGGIVVDKVIIVAHAFSSTAKQRAEDLGFSLHTLNELELGSLGMFEQDNSDVSGGWWLSAENGEHGKQVKVTLFDKSGNNIPLNSTVITPRTSKVNLGSARNWAQRLLENSAGKFADQQYREHAGEMISVIIEVSFSNHKARYGKNSANLGKMVFDFGNKMQFPLMQSKSFELITEQGKTKKIVRETGIGKEGKLNLTYEMNESDKHPPSIRVDHEGLDGEKPKSKIITAKIKF